MVYRVTPSAAAAFLNPAFDNEYPAILHLPHRFKFLKFFHPYGTAGTSNLYDFRHHLLHISRLIAT